MTDTVNAILLKNDDRVLLDAIRRKRAIGWSVRKIAAYYNIYEGQHVHGTPEDTRGMIPAKLYQAVAGVTKRDGSQGEATG